MSFFFCFHIGDQEIIHLCGDEPITSDIRLIHFLAISGVPFSKGWVRQEDFWTVAFDSKADINNEKDDLFTYVYFFHVAFCVINFKWTSNIMSDGLESYSNMKTCFSRGQFHYIHYTDNTNMKALVKGVLYLEMINLYMNMQNITKKNTSS
jgi:hypothetical protein